MSSILDEIANIHTSKNNFKHINDLKKMLNLKPNEKIKDVSTHRLKSLVDAYGYAAKLYLKTYAALAGSEESHRIEGLLI